jgi:hypothetical protein
VDCVHCLNASAVTRLNDAGSLSGNMPDLYFGRIPFEAGQETVLSKVSLVARQLPYANAWIVRDWCRPYPIQFSVYK